MPFADTLMLPAGTNITKLINLPLSGGWNGSVKISLVSNASITVNTMQLKRDAAASGIISRSVSTPFTIDADERSEFILQTYESMLYITYTCTSDVSLCIESKRGA